MKWRLGLLAVAATIFSSIPALHATLTVPSTLEYMIDFSDTIIIGHVKDKYSYWENQKIYTKIVIDVEQFVKNSYREKSTEIVLKVPGGKVGDTRLRVSGAPTFKVREKVMLFLKKTNHDYFPYGLSYGVYRISFDKEEGKEFIDGPFFNSPHHYDLKTRQEVRNPQPLGRKELGAFLDHLKNLIHQGQ